MCERCKILEEAIWQFWVAIHPTLAWIDAETALRCLRIEHVTIRDDALPRLEALEERARQQGPAAGLIATLERLIAEAEQKCRETDT